MFLSQQNDLESMTPQDVWMRAIQVLQPKAYLETVEYQDLMAALGSPIGRRSRELLQFGAQNHLAIIDQDATPTTYAVGKAWIALQVVYGQAQ